VELSGAVKGARAAAEVERTTSRELGDGDSCGERLT
jgi:hypothetical protein